MLLSKRSHPPLLVSLLFFLLPAAARAQITNVTNDQATPIPGVRHDYIHMLNETVNPATGQVSVRINPPVPGGRGLTLAFAFAYDSSGVHHLKPNSLGGATWTSNNSYLAKGGWSYTVPQLSEAVGSITRKVGGTTYTCYYYTEYVFQDASGSRHALNISIGQDNSPNCFVNSILSGGDDFVIAKTTGWPQGSSGPVEPVTIADADGTVSYFSNSVLHSIVPGPYTAALPNYVEDRNGNKIIVTDSGNGAFHYTDTLGRTVLSSSGFGATTDTITVAGVSQPYTVTWRNVSSNFPAPHFTTQNPPNCPGISGDNETQSVVSTITLPNGKTYTFQYGLDDPSNSNPYGLLSRITYPTGGWVKYTWGANPLSDAAHSQTTSSGGCDYRYDTFAVTKRTVSFDGITPALEQDFVYASTSWNDPNFWGRWTSKQVNLTTKDLLLGTNSNTVFTYTPVSIPIPPNEFSIFGGQIPLEQTITYKDGAANTLRTVNKTWSGQYLLTSEQTTLENGLTSQVTYSYSAGAQIREKDEYDYGQGTPARKTVTTYQAFASTPIYPSGPSIFDRPCTTIVYDSGGTNVVAETDYFYDGTSSTTPCSTATTQALPGSGSYSGHDETLYGTIASVARGNLTKVIKKCFQGAQTCPSGNPTTTFTYDETGQVLTMIDPCGNAACSDMTGTNHTTTYSYADSYTVLSGGVNINYTPASNTNAFLTQITDPLTHTQNFKYDFNNGQLTSSNDPNLLSTTYIYNDSLARPTQANSPDGGQTTVSYNDTAPSPTVTTSKKINSTQTLTSVGIMDGLGHVVQSKLCEDGPACAQPIKTDTSYDGLSRVRTRSNPHRTGSAPTDGTTTFYYDALGRTCLVVPPDGILPTGNVCPATSPANDVFTTYSGNTTTVKDQAGKSRKSVSDGLGRLTQVFEDPSALNYETDYTYDLLDNLLSVNQKGNDPSSANWRTRTFVYDSLSRLTSSTNPESNTQPVTPFAIVPTSYVYDANANVSTKTAPAPNQTGTATVTTTFAYDILNRLTQKSFSDSTPTVKYGYDAVAPSGCTLPTLIIHNGIGQRTSMCDAAGAEAWSYDITANVGWMITDARTTNSVTKSTIVQNNLAGSAATLTYPSGRIITYTFDAAARPLSAIDSTGPINYATAAAYAPTGALSFLTNGASLVSNLYYNGRLQPCRISVKNTGTAPATCTDAATGNVLDFTYNFSVGIADNGNVTGITNNRDTTRSQSLVYDSLNRISTAKTTSTSGATCWDEAFGYDPWGNLLTIGRIAGYACSNEELLNSMATPQNRISGDTYDTAGNLTAIPTIATYTYNAENQLTATAGVTYTYDGDGKRVQKSSGKLYWYGMGSDPLDETDLAGNSNNAGFNEYIFFGGKRIARRDYQNSVNYYFADHLGTARIVTNSSGTPVDDSDFYPFGGERAIVGPSSGNPYKFTGKERDAESSLDYFNARHYSSALGRFMSVDPNNAGEVDEDPQTWNAYSYVRNNPLRYVDPDGTNVLVCIVGQDKCHDYTDDQYARLLKEQNGKGGITLPDQALPNGDITCRGVKCGTATYFEPPMESANGANFAIGGLFELAFKGGMSLLEGLFGSGARTTGQAVTGAAANAGSGATEQVVASGTKAAVQEAVERGAVSEAQKAAVKRALARGAVDSKFTIQKLGDGSVKVITEVAGRAGGRATYEKIISAGGETVPGSVIQKAYDAAGNLVHVDAKY